MSCFYLVLLTVVGCTCQFMMEKQAFTINGTNAQANLTWSLDLTEVLHVLPTLKWRHMVLVYEPCFHEAAQVLLSSSDYITMLTTDHFHGLHANDRMRQLYESFSPALNVILIAQRNTAINILKTVDEVDGLSGRSTELSHHSYWLVVCPHRWGSYTGRLAYLEHVAVLSTFQNRTNLWRLVISRSGRQFVSQGDCDPIHSIHDVFPNIRFGLNGRILTVAAMENGPFVIATKTGFEGYSVDILETMAKLLNFSYRIVYPPDMRWGKLVNGSWDGLIGQLERREVDMLIGSVTIHEDREKVMDFLNPPVFTKADDIIYKLQSLTGERTLMYLHIFKPLVLVALCGTLLAIPVIIHVFYMLDRINGTESSSPSYHLVNIAKHCLYATGIIVNRGVEPSIRPKAYSTRVLLFSWGVFSVIMAGCYSANLVAVFSVHKERLPFTNLGELVRQKEYKFGFESGSIREHIFKNSKYEDMKLFWEGVLEFNKTDPEVLSEDANLHFSKMRSEKYALVGTRFRLAALARSDCSLRLIGDVRSLVYYGIGVPTDYPLKREFENTLSQISDSGLFDFWWRRWHKETDDLCNDVDTHRKLNLIDLASAFYILVSGTGCAVLAVIVEYFLKPFHLSSIGNKTT